MDTKKKTTQQADPSVNGNGAGGQIDTSGWEEEQLGFCPFWHPRPGQFFIGTPTARDNRDPDFIRYMFVAQQDVLCHRGPREENGEPAGEDVMVRKGEEFSVSAFVQTADRFDEYLGYDFPVLVKVTADRKVKSGQGSVWIFKAQTPPDTKRRLEAARKERRLAEMKRSRELSIKNDAPEGSGLEA